MKTVSLRMKWPALALALVLSSSAAAEEVKHTHHSWLHHALFELRLARTEVQNARHDYGGHRTAAVLAIDDSIRHLEYVTGHPHYKIIIVDYKPHANEHHKFESHVHHALHALRHARHELRESKLDFGGRKELIFKETEVAIKELEHLARHHRKPKK